MSSKDENEETNLLELERSAWSAIVGGTLPTYLAKLEKRIEELEAREK